MVILVGQANSQFGDAERSGQLPRSAMQADMGLTTLIAPHFNLPPAHIANASAEGFGDGFFGRPPGGQGFDTAGTMLTLPPGENTLEEAVAVSCNRFLDAFDFNDINADSEHF